MKLPILAEKVLERRAASEQVLEWKKNGDRVVFTNGCFDLLHPGHLDLLTKAKESGDRLIVGLNSDDSVKRLEKGSERPIQHEGERAVLLAALEMVDIVVLFDEDTPLRLIKSIGPDVLVKGGDYEESAIVGKDHVEKNGGRVVRVPLLPGYSSSELIERIRSSVSKDGS